MDAILPCTVRGYGITEYEIYFDGVYQYTHTVNFDAAISGAYEGTVWP